MTHLYESTKPSLSFSLPLEPRRLLRARERIRDYLHEQRVEGRAIDDVVLAIEEAMTNAVRHSQAERDLEVEVRFEDRDLRVRVRDYGKGFDVGAFDREHLPDLLGTGGRGLFLIRELMDDLELSSNGGVEVRAAKRAVLPADHEEIRRARSPRKALHVFESYRGERQRAFLEEMSEAFASLDWEFRYQFVNAAFERHLRRSREELLGRTAWEALQIAADHPAAAPYHEAMELGRSSIVEYQSPMTGGWIEVRVYPTSSGISFYLRDISERKRKERERDEFLRSLEADLSALTRMHDLGARLLEAGGLQSFLQEVMDAAVAVVGAQFGTLQLLEGDSLRIVVHHDHQQPFLDFFAAAENVASVCGEAARRGERVVVEDVETSPVFVGTPSLGVMRQAGVRAVQSTPLLTRGGALLGILTTQWAEPYRPNEHDFWRIDLLARQASDLIEIGRTEAAVRESEERLRSAKEAAGLGIQDYDVDSGKVTWDRRAREIWGVGEDEEVTYETFLSGVHPEDREAMLAAVDAATDPASGGQGSTSYRVISRTDGRERWVSASWRVVFEDGRARRMIGIVEDVSERRQAEDRLRQTLDSLLDPHVLLEAVRDEEGNIVDFVFADANPAACRFNGLRYEELVGTRLLGLHPAVGTTELFDTYVKLVETGEPLVLDDWSYPQDLLGGEIRRYDVRAVRVGDGLSQTWRDVTERRLAEEALRERARLAAAQARVEALVHSSLDDEEIIAAALREGAEAIGAETAGLSLHEDAERRFRVAYVHNYPPDKIGILIPDEADTHGVEAMRTGQTIAIDDTQTDPRVVRELMAEWEIKSVICAPLVVRGRPIGVAYYNYHSAAHQFTYREIDFVTALAASFSSALQNARLYAEQSNIALTLQQAFTHTLPAFEGLDLGVVGLSASQPALVGGDFWDVFPLPDDKVLIAIGDVAGKGIQAAALTETVHSTMRAFARIDDSPAFVLRKTNELLMADEGVETFVTALVAVMDRRSGAAKLASAGHPGPIHVSSAGCGVLDPAYGPPLGSFPAEYASTTVEVGRGDALVLHTDGVTEARSSGLLFGEDNAVVVVCAHRGEPAQQMADALASAAASFADELKDDLQVLVIRRV